MKNEEKHNSDAHGDNAGFRGKVPDERDEDERAGNYGEKINQSLIHGQPP